METPTLPLLREGGKKNSKKKWTAGKWYNFYPPYSSRRKRNDWEERDLARLSSCPGRDGGSRKKKKRKKDE